MKTTYRNIHWGAIALFYVIAIALRLMTLLLGWQYPVLKENYLFQLSTGLGPAVGAIAAMAIFGSKTEYTLMGKSVCKSLATIAVPCLVFDILRVLLCGIILV